MVDRDSPIALYEQIKQALQQEILSGRVGPGDALPSEREICETFDVSRITATRALSELVQLGLVRRQHGKGSFVAETRIRRTFDQIMGLTESLRRQGIATRARVLSLAPADDLPSELAGLDAPFVCLRRLRFIHDTPAVLSTSYLRAEIVAGLPARTFETQSLYELIESRLGKPIVRNEQLMSPIAATDEIAHHLGVAVGSPHMAFRGTTIVDGGAIVELTRSVFRGDMFEFKATMGRGAAGFEPRDGAVIAVKGKSNRRPR